jgi:hypothetical protein
MSDSEIRHAMQLIGIEVERANSLFPNDESEAVCELLRRSHENPDLKKGMLFMCALNVIREGREKRVWLPGGARMGASFLSSGKKRKPAVGASSQYRKSAKAALIRAIEHQFGSHGAASLVRRINPKTGEVVAEHRSADDIRKSLGSALAAKL